jgi:hypothetical protein
LDGSYDASKHLKRWYMSESRLIFWYCRCWISVATKSCSFFDKDIALTSPQLRSTLLGVCGWHRSISKVRALARSGLGDEERRLNLGLSSCIPEGLLTLSYLLRSLASEVNDVARYTLTANILAVSEFTHVHVVLGNTTSPHKEAVHFC